MSQTNGANTITADGAYDLLYHLADDSVHPVQFSHTLINSQLPPDFISLSNTYKVDTDDINLSYIDGTNKTYNSGEWKSIGATMNYESGPISGYGGMIDLNDTFMFNIMKFNGVEAVSLVEGTNGNSAYIKKMKRMVDGQNFTYIQVRQEFDSTSNYESATSYQGVYEMLLYISKNVTGPIILVGNFNIHGYNKIAEKIFDSKNYHYVDLTSTITCNDQEGLASPDGFIISKSLYGRVEYQIEPVNTTSWQGYSLILKLSRMGFPGTYNTTSKLFDTYVDTVSKWWNTENSALNYYKKVVTLPDKTVMDTWTDENIIPGNMASQVVIKTLGTA